jgi:hypothetical protein
MRQGGQRLPESRWVCPWLPYRDGTREAVLARYRRYVLAELADALSSPSPHRRAPRLRPV